MYTFPNRLKITFFVLILVGALGLVAGFVMAPSTVAEAQAMVADTHNGEEHGESHKQTAVTHADATHHEEKKHDSETHASKSHASEESHVGESHDDDHGEHLLHQLQNKPWAALYVAAFFFMMISLGTLAFYAIQRDAQAGWSILLFT